MLLQRTENMGTDVSNIATGGVGAAALRPAAATPPRSSAVQMPEAPKVQAPKPVAIHFDAAEVRQTVVDAVKMLNEQINANNRGLGFHVDDAVGGPVVTVRSSTTGEVVRQIPNETVVNIAHNFERMKGLLFSAKS
jgi:flagellar protein FlaG